MSGNSSVWIAFISGSLNGLTFVSFSLAVFVCFAPAAPTCEYLSQKASPAALFSPFSLSPLFRSFVCL